MPRTSNRVKETTTTTGTGTITLDGAATQFVAFQSVWSAGTRMICYCIQANSGGDWEVGYGTLASTTTLSRDVIVASSNSGSAVNFGSGTKTVFATLSGHTAGGIGRAVAVANGSALTLGMY